MTLKQSDFLLDVWAFHNGKKLHPYKGERGDKKGLYSVNFTNDMTGFEAMTEGELIAAITSGRFKDRGTIRMLPLDFLPGAERNAFAPEFYNGKRIKDF